MWNGGTLTISNSTLSGNTVSGYHAQGGGVANNPFCTLTLAYTLVAGNTAPTGQEINNSGTITADNHNLFGVDGTAGAVGFLPGSTDIVPPAGLQLPDILAPTLADNGGPTLTHALVPGSLARNAGPRHCRALRRRRE